MKININKGISLIEILIVISIILILAAIVVPNLSFIKKQQALQTTKEDIVSLLNEARNSTISSKNSLTYGVHFQADRAILFSGASYSDSPNNKQISFDSSVTIPATGGINIGGGSDVVFQRLTGDTINNGTIVIQLVSDATKQKIISINSIGIISSN